MLTQRTNVFSLAIFNGIVILMYIVIFWGDDKVWQRGRERRHCGASTAHTKLENCEWWIRIYSLDGCDGTMATFSR